MELIVEFPLQIVANYFWASNLDVALDDNISYLIGKHFFENSIEFKIKSLDFIKPKPNLNYDLIRYKIPVGLNSDSFQVSWILDELKK